MMAAAARHLTMTDRELREGRWIQHVGFELAGKTLAIIGAGSIGTAIGRIAAGGFGMRIIGFRRRSALASSGVEGTSPYALVTSDFSVAVRDADFVSINIPATPENLQFVNRARLAQLKPSAWLINTARGAVVDEVALYDALTWGALAGAALDVFAREPYEPADGRDLRRLPNVILVPHIGSHTLEANRRMAERAMRNVLSGDARRFEDMDLLNPQVLPLLA